MLVLIPLARAVAPEAEAFTDAEPGGGFGAVVAAPGDVDGDGLGDLLLGHTANTGAQPIATLFLASGPRDASTQRFTGDTYAYGATLAGLGDVDGDGAPDVAIGDWMDGEIELRRGEDGLLGSASYLRTTGADKLGYLLAGPGDLDGDGLSDLVSWAPDAGEEGRIHRFDGGATESCGGSTPSDYVRSLAGVGDTGGDGLADYAYATISDDEIDNSAVTLVHGGPCGEEERVDARALWQDEVERVAVGPGEDLDGDGRTEALAMVAEASGGVELVRIFGDGRSEDAETLVYWATEPGVLEVSALTVGDVDGDGAPEIAVSVAGEGADHGFAEVLTATGDPVYVFEELPGDVSRSSGTGWTLAAPGDVDGDGLADLLVGGLAQEAYVVYARPDADSPVDHKDREDGCGCASSGSPALWPLALALLAAHRPRTHHPSPRT